MLRHVAGALLLLGGTAPMCRAQNTVATQDHTWDFSVWAAGETGEETTNSLTQAQIWSAGVLIGRRLTDEKGRSWWQGSLEYGADVAPLFIQTAPNIEHGIAFTPVILRWNSSLHAGPVEPYIELAGGGVVTSENLPAGDTSNFNFSARGGGGIYLVAKGRRRALDIGCRWSHISNANLGNRNPEFNGIEFIVGYHWFK